MKARKAKPTKPMAFTQTVDAEVFLQTVMKHLVLWNNSQDAELKSELTVLEMFRNFCHTLRTGHYTRTAPMIKAACRELNVPNTRDAIDSIFQPKKGDSNGTQ